MKDLMIFENAEFGQMRTVTINNEPWFIGKDVATALGYKNTKDALISHVDKEDRRIIQRSEIATIENRIPKEAFPVNFVSAEIPPRGLTAINESGLYALIFGSKLESANKFKHWVTSEVLPSLRKTGFYEMPKKKKRNSQLSSINMLAKNITNIFTKAGVDPMLIAAETKRLYKQEAGIDIQIPLLTDKETMPKLYDCTEIAKELGVMSKSGKPHNQAVGDIIRKLDITEAETKTTAFSRNGHDDVTVQYLPSVVEKVRAWLEEKSYPTKIPYVDSKGNSKIRTVVYYE